MAGCRSWAHNEGWWSSAACSNPAARLREIDGGLLGMASWAELDSPSLLLTLIPHPFFSAEAVPTPSARLPPEARRQACAQRFSARKRALLPKKIVGLWKKLYFIFIEMLVPADTHSITRNWACDKCGQAHQSNNDDTWQSWFTYAVCTCNTYIWFTSL
jgi:hypothetical protein